MPAMRLPGECVVSATGTAEAFSDLSTLRQMLRFEAALAEAVAAVGLIPKKHATRSRKDATRRCTIPRCWCRRHGAA
jgi:adenylosuccinate lyase